jgi:hypothetical protein
MVIIHTIPKEQRIEAFFPKTESVFPSAVKADVPHSYAHPLLLKVAA